ncbi:3-oxoacyl-ACP synthase III family protein [Teredinibacter sp. KSP-S5-2]|uniref:3-oxoacyl-ACP synthase III family protein n=1 Tax=Teredinibacter sp. KSP-S5-2 TaxID=3034506 RepID=UPI002934F5C5|nr:3-oxoacyl-[acyl-carrier-protein] synthase III C-terminal domain-containing protein [Teredinibacter sp. KSP-S5-2]WNO11168.1 3-oxoacyl-[acyl-carrier-protein] synthase III C-terminal domain-containing protein [Teredinibacter sp. KSP-S5-2]
MSRIEATGSYLPSKIVPNSTFVGGNALFDSMDEYFSGFEERRHANSDETALMMGVEAAKDALEGSKYSASDIDLIIGIIQPSRNLYGDDLNLMQHQLEAWNASVYPLNTACATFISAVSIADSYIRTGKAKVVLVVTSTDWVNTVLDTEKPNYAFAGDGAGAVILDGEYNSFIDQNELNNSKPEVFDALVMKNPQFTGKKEFFTVSPPKGRTTVKDLILFPSSVAKTLVDRNKDIEIDCAIMHQSGYKMMQTWADKLGIEEDKIKHTIGLYANMTVANIPVTLDYWSKKGEIKRDEVLLFMAPSAGGYAAAMLWRY